MPVPTRTWSLSEPSDGDSFLRGSCEDDLMQHLPFLPVGGERMTFSLLLLGADWILVDLMALSGLQGWVLAFTEHMCTCQALCQGLCISYSFLRMSLSNKYIISILHRRKPKPLGFMCRPNWLQSLLSFPYSSALISLVKMRLTVWSNHLQILYDRKNVNIHYMQVIYPI